MYTQDILDDLSDLTIPSLEVQMAYCLKVLGPYKTPIEITTPVALTGFLTNTHDLNYLDYLGESQLARNRGMNQSSQSYMYEKYIK